MTHANFRIHMTSLALVGSRLGGLDADPYNLGAGVAVHTGGEGFDVDVVRERHLAGADPDDLDARGEVRGADVEQGIEAAGTHEGWVEEVGFVGRREDEDASEVFDAVHLVEEGREDVEAGGA